jgi:hypothetical protein
MKYIFHYMPLKIYSRIKDKQLTTREGRSSRTREATHNARRSFISYKGSNSQCEKVGQLMQAKSKAQHTRRSVSSCKQKVKHNTREGRSAHASKKQSTTHEKVGSHSCKGKKQLTNARRSLARRSQLVQRDEPTHDTHTST